MTRFTRLLAVSLALLIAVTSQQMALARAVTTDVTGQVVLCTGQGLTTVAVDAQGNPTGPVHICPDCAMSFMEAVAPSAGLTPIVVHMQTLGQTFVTALQTPSVHIPVHARGPPLSV